MLNVEVAQPTSGGDIEFRDRANQQWATIRGVVIENFRLCIGANVDNKPRERGDLLASDMVGHHNRPLQHNPRWHSNQNRIGRKSIIENREVVRSLGRHRSQQSRPLINTLLAGRHTRRQLQVHQPLRPR